jgi:hypothetical protein
MESINDDNVAPNGERVFLEMLRFLKIFPFHEFQITPAAVVCEYIHSFQRQGLLIHIINETELEPCLHRLGSTWIKIEEKGDVIFGL